MTELSIRVFKRGSALALAGALVVSLMSSSVAAQTPAAAAAPVDPNSGNLTFTGGLDVPTKYVFRGIVQEKDSKLTLFPYGDMAIWFYTG